VRSNRERNHAVSTGVLPVVDWDEVDVDESQLSIARDFDDWAPVPMLSFPSRRRPRIVHNPDVITRLVNEGRILFSGNVNRLTFLRMREAALLAVAPRLSGPPLSLRAKGVQMFAGMSSYPVQIYTPLLPHHTDAEVANLINLAELLAMLQVTGY